MWSLGCILGEMLSKRPVFPGTSTLNQVERVIELTGRPTAEDVASIKSSLASTMLESLPSTRQKSYHATFPGASEQAIDFLKRLLVFNPKKRLSVDQALRHPYVAQFHNSDEEPTCPRPIRICIDDNHKFSIREYRERLYREISQKKKEIRRRVLASRGYYRNQAQP
jgi:mitogen-activated protein kinase 15